MCMHSLYAGDRDVTPRVISKLWIDFDILGVFDPKVLGVSINGGPTFLSQDILISHSIRSAHTRNPHIQETLHFNPRS